MPFSLDVLAETQFNVGTWRLVVRSQRDLSTSSLLYGGEGYRWEEVAIAPRHTSGVATFIGGLPTAVLDLSIFRQRFYFGRCVEISRTTYPKLQLPKIYRSATQEDMVCLSCTATGERVCLAAEGFGNRHCYLETIADKVTTPIPRLTHLAAASRTRVSSHANSSIMYSRFAFFEPVGAAATMWLDYSPPHLGKPGSISSRVAPGFSQVGIVPDDAADRPVFSGISRFPRPCVPAPLHTRLASPSSAAKASIGRMEGRKCARGRRCVLQNIPPDLSQCVFVIEQALSVRALQELVTAAGSETIGKILHYSPVDMMQLGVQLQPLHPLGHAYVLEANGRLFFPPRLTGFDSRPDNSRIYSRGNRAGRCRWSAGFLGDIPFPLAATPYPPHIILVSRPNLHSPFSTTSLRRLMPGCTIVVRNSIRNRI
ncbi:hypothetical protein PR048_031216 [Dryococelus australis]|uniref:Inositol 1,4,5-trisphosphate/ryanodine receptor domain-containing protein n=1 Tax=Dryococelus australis TaxID=614101 RepID=A0ABQ9G4M8_9NEOP|nr:hypothetical protein PR048_031216 [Dryococelus australis]